jgi:hypothetical protein
MTLSAPPAPSTRVTRAAGATAPTHPLFDPPSHQKVSRSAPSLLRRVVSCVVLAAAIAGVVALVSASTRLRGVSATVAALAAAALSLAVAAALLRGAIRRRTLARGTVTGTQSAA